MCRSARASTAALLAFVGVAARAHRTEAQACPPTPPGWHPHVTARPGPTLLATTTVAFEVDLERVFCTPSRAIAASVNASEIRITIAEGGHAGEALPVRPGARGALEVTLPAAGAYALRVESVAQPTLVPAVIRTRALEPAHTLPVTLAPRISSLDARRRVRCGAMSVRDEAGHATATVETHGRAAAFALEPGTYTATWHCRTDRAATLVVTRAGVQSLVFNGSEVHLGVDWLPPDGQMYRAVIAREDGWTSASGEREPSLHLGDNPVDLDVPPGPAVIRLLRTPRTDPCDASDTTRVWTEVYRENIEVPTQQVLSLRWSMPNVVAGQGSATTPWVDLATLAHTEITDEAPLAPAPDDVFGVTAHDGTVVFIGNDRVYRLDGRWSARALGTGIYRAGSMAGAIGPGPTDRSLVVDALRRDAVAWVRGGDLVSYATPQGFSQERLPLAERAGPFPCFATGIAVPSAHDVVVVGHCGGSLSTGQPGRDEGFIAERTDTGWTVRAERSPPLRALAREGDTLLVAVGDHGTLMWRRNGVWSRARTAADETWTGVALHDRVAVLQSAHGRLVELTPHGADPLPVWTGDDPHRAQAIARQEGTRFCLVRRGVVVLYPAVHRARDEGDGGTVLHGSFVALHAPRGASRVLVDESVGEALTLTCDGESVWVMLRDTTGTVQWLRL